jgi:hypothetical protein
LTTGLVAGAASGSAAVVVSTGVEVASGSAAGASGSAAGAAGSGAVVVASTGAVSVLGTSWAASEVEERARTAAIAVVPRRYCLRVYIMKNEHARTLRGRIVSDESDRGDDELKTKSS